MGEFVVVSKLWVTQWKAYINFDNFMHNDYELEDDYELEEEPLVL
jgi:hypothetical protein